MITDVVIWWNGVLHLGYFDTMKVCVVGSQRVYLQNNISEMSRSECRTIISFILMVMYHTFPQYLKHYSLYCIILVGNVYLKYINHIKYL